MSAPLPLILASASPRRRALLCELGVSFAVDAADVDESLPDGIAPDLAVVHLASRKALACAPAHPDCVLLGADTVVSLDGRILGKPRDRDHAKEMLTALSGRTHTVYTGIALCLHGSALTAAAKRLCTHGAPSGARCVRYHEKADRYTVCEAIATHVTFFPLTEAQIEAYLATDEPYDKAGAYAIQGLAHAFVAELLGDHSNVVGLPTEALAHLWQFATGHSLCDGE